MLVRNVVTDPIKMKQVVLDQKLIPVQLYDALHQSSGNGAHYILTFCPAGDAGITMEEITGINENGKYETKQLSIATTELLTEGIDADLKAWLMRDDYTFRTLPRTLRSTCTTVLDDMHLERLNNLLFGAEIPQGLQTLILDHRLNSDWYEKITYHDIAVLAGKRVRAERSVKVDPDGRNRPTSTAWIVYYGNRPACHINMRSHDKSLTLKNAIRAVEITHNTLLTEESPWISFKVYNPVMR